jgi:hypothetical protein
MNLGQRQEAFAELVPHLLLKAHELGFRVRIGDVFRDPRAHGEWGEDLGPYGNPKSQHKNKCAIDLNLRHPLHGMVWSTEGHQELGEWWEQQHPYCRWGGRYEDGGHYEFLKWREDDG